MFDIPTLLYPERLGGDQWNLMVLKIWIPMPWNPLLEKVTTFFHHALEHLLFLQGLDNCHYGKTSHNNSLQIHEEVISCISD
jgi:hypothetical protein